MSRKPNWGSASTLTIPSVHFRQYEGVPRLESGLPDYKAMNDHLSYMNGGGDCTITRFTA